MTVRDSVFIDGREAEYKQWPDTVDGLIDDNGTSRTMTDAERLVVATRLETETRQVKRQAVDNAVATLRLWADDAEATTVTSANAVAVLNTTLDRLAVFFDRFADLVESRQL